MPPARRLRCVACSQAQTLESFTDRMRQSHATERVCKSCQQAETVAAHDPRRTYRCNGCGHSTHDFTDDEIAAEANERMCRTCVTTGHNVREHPEKHMVAIHHAHPADVGHHQQPLHHQHHHTHQCEDDEAEHEDDEGGAERYMRCVACGRATHNFCDAMIEAPDSLRVCRDCEPEDKDDEENDSEHAASAPAGHGGAFVHHGAGKARFAEAVPASAPIVTAHKSSTTWQPSVATERPYAGDRSLRCSACSRASRNFTVLQAAALAEKRKCNDCI